MRARFIFVAVLVVLAAALVGLVAAPKRPEPNQPPRPAAMDAMSRPLDLGPPGDDAHVGWADEVMPMHQAVRRAVRRFDGKVLDIALVAAPPDSGNAHPLVYRIRVLTRSRDVLDIRMDAFTGRFLELRGADIGAARRTGKDD